MRRTMLVAVLTAALTVFTAGPAFAAHCVNLSKKADAGNHMNVLITPTGPDSVDVSMLGNGGYADVYLDLNMNYRLDSADLLQEEDVMVGKNHSPNADHDNPWVNPGAWNKFFESDNATTEHGMGFHHED